MVDKDADSDAFPYCPTEFTEHLKAAAVQLSERYNDVLPREAIAAVVQAAGQAVVTQAEVTGFGAAAVLAERAVARARAELAVACGAPVRDLPYPVSEGPAAAWTYLLDGVAVVRAIGQFDLETGPILRAELNRAMGSGRRLILVDLGRVSFMDPAGLSPLVAMARTARDTGQRLGLSQVPAAVRGLIEVSGLAAEFIRAERDGSAGTTGSEEDEQAS